MERCKECANHVVDDLEKINAENSHLPMPLDAKFGVDSAEIEPQKK